MGCANFRPVFGDKEATLSGMERVVDSAADRGCDLVVFPEGALSSWSFCAACRDAGRPCRWHLDQAETSDGPAVRRMAERCRRHDLYTVFGFVERDAERPEVLYNAAAIVGPTGVLGTYRKMHLGDLPATTEGITFVPGTDLPLWPTRFGPIGVCICFDFWLNPEVPRLLALQGARLLVNPTACLSTTSRDEIVYGALVRGRENLSFVAVANLVGRPGDPNGDRFAGHSVITGPERPSFNRPLAEAGEGEELIVATLDLGELDRWADYYPWRAWRQGRLAGASRLIADQFAALADGADGDGVR